MVLKIFIRENNQLPEEKRLKNKSRKQHHLLTKLAVKNGQKEKLKIKQIMQYFLMRHYTNAQSMKFQK